MRKEESRPSIALVTSSLGEVGSGQGRFASNLARGLSKSGFDVTVCAGAAALTARNALERANVRLKTLDWKVSSGHFKARLVSPLNTVAKGLAGLAQSLEPRDWYVVLSDDAVRLPTYLDGRRTAYVSQGDLNLLFLEHSFYRTNGIVKRLLSTAAAHNILENARAARAYRVRLANSDFCRKMMSFVYGVGFSGVVYPPVDFEVFSPPATPPKGRGEFALSVARNLNEPAVDVLTKIARTVPLKVVGGAAISSAENLGRVSDETLSSLYQEATVLVHPAPTEYFGYPVLEAMACGTPAVAFDWGGPGEIIRSGVDGWTVSDAASLIDKVRTIMERGYDSTYRVAANRSAQRFSMQAAADSLARSLGIETR